MPKKKIFATEAMKELLKLSRMSYEDMTAKLLSLGKRAAKEPIEHINTIGRHNRTVLIETLRIAFSTEKTEQIRLLIKFAKVLLSREGIDISITDSDGKNVKNYLDELFEKITHYEKTGAPPAILIELTIELNELARLYQTWRTVGYRADAAGSIEHAYNTDTCEIYKLEKISTKLPRHLTAYADYITHEIAPRGLTRTFISIKLRVSYPEMDALKASRFYSAEHFELTESTTHIDLQFPAVDFDALDTKDTPNIVILKYVDRVKQLRAEVARLTTGSVVFSPTEFFKSTERKPRNVATNHAGAGMGAGESDTVSAAAAEAEESEDSRRNPSVTVKK